MEFLVVSLLNGLSYGLLLFMLSAGLTLIFSMMGVLNFAHASFYMAGAYVASTLAPAVGFWWALALAPPVVGLLGAAFERGCLRPLRARGAGQGHLPELLATFGLAYLMLEAVQLLWGRAPVEFRPPAGLQGPAFTLVGLPDGGLRVVGGAAPTALCRAAAEGLGGGGGGGCTPFPATRAFMAAVALSMLGALAALLAWSRIGLVVRAAITHAQAVEALGHDVSRVFTGVFGAGSALAALAGVVGGSTFVTEPQMAAAVGPVVFVVVVVGGVGSLGGAFLASLLIGVVQTFAVGVDASLADALARLGLGRLAAEADAASLLHLSVSQLAPLLPYLLLIGVLVLRPRGLLGAREA